VKFNVINLVKYESLYNEGMRPIVWSQKKFTETGLTWHRDGADVHYYANRHGHGRTTFSLTFKYTFESRDDTVYFAYCYPYTYSDLTSFLGSLKDAYPSILRVDTLCHTLAGNPCPMLTITANLPTYKSWETEQQEYGLSENARRFLRNKNLKNRSDQDHRGKKVVVLTARVHPGETNASFMM
jgi:hypothetical protein